MLHERELSMNPKAFAIGVRVEHLAHLINESQYGEGYPEEVLRSACVLAVML